MDTSEFRMMSGLRVLLATSALLITWIDPSEPSGYVTTTYVTLAAYTLYATILYVIALRDGTLSTPVEYALPWIDVGVYTTLIALSGGSNSVYFFLFTFPLLGAAFRWGYRAGLAVTFVSVILFAIVGLATERDDPQFSLSRFLLRASWLPILGFIISYFGGYELRLRQRLALLRDLSMISSPRTNANRALTDALRRLCDFYQAEACVMALEPRHGRAWEIRRASRAARTDEENAQAVPAGVAQSLVGIGEADVVFYRAPGRLRERLVGSSDMVRWREVAELLGVSSFISVPVRLGVRPIGRLFIGADDPHFDREEGDFLLHAVDQLMSAIDYIDLVDRITTRSADEERRRIALDIHDRVLQPYIGLQLAAAALHRQASESSSSVPPTLTDNINKLVQLASEGIANLRQYTHALRAHASHGFAESMRRFADGFTDATGIEVGLSMDPNVRLDDRVAAELFSMAAEAASNVRRHTTASRVHIAVRASNGRLVLQIDNDTAARPPGSFMPRSISERAATLGGTVTVESDDLTTTILIELPYMAAEAAAVQHSPGRDTRTTR